MNDTMSIFTEELCYGKEYKKTVDVARRLNKMRVSFYKIN